MTQPLGRWERAHQHVTQYAVSTQSVRSQYAVSTQSVRSQYAVSTQSVRSQHANHRNLEAT
ncbi:hypothetical protein JZ785_21290 [Alicyclobacillus curvatus]|nr:hypothetical protein JZ785_21290 [Alicyclobacillus curvatus]